jgi:hypothetical protein
MDAVQAAVLAADRIRVGQEPTAEVLSIADPDVLEAELATITRPAAPGASLEEIRPPIAAAAEAASAGEGKQQGTASNLLTLPGEEEDEQDALPATAGSAIGRPSSYTHEEAATICAWVQKGGSLQSYCELTGRGSDAVYRWLRARADFRAAYALAHEDRADTLVDEMLKIADAAEKATEIAEVQAARLRIDTRKWIAEKLRPKKWGQQEEQNAGRQVQINIGIPRRTDNEPVHVVASQ